MLDVSAALALLVAASVVVCVASKTTSAKLTFPPYFPAFPPAFS
jgi:hypothetical protein